MKKPKFNIDDIVCMPDNFHFNPADKVLSVGKVIAVHIYNGKGLFADSDLRGKIVYSISGFSLRANEEDLKLYSEVKK